ncbi:conserved hypothetical protein [Talaromyces stipitatus ATCC 10500]|uniref:Dimerizing cyclase tstC n=1 Tax=Talaromyces stipitatus (strain ATCC 10500 / CBS 375.48 / QM 6759 / NRRL 1006) TaxID=441959 RepID=TSTC_TALSN|nr:uncharacterized protein TSTA_048460 [Talaromyces stipitatus ATCC 10500]B8MKZ0.1 RecName: Full=Dimerizing cyclase tstC; AltName: Full=Phomoidride biosynthesis cluster protein C; Flags: Precursor [Talaromyces stipitatus ATCC 10500]EED15406.1 conserved hypothetical protein [Talaromyces stipitatus ATCC 10500]
MRLSTLSSLLLGSSSIVFARVPPTVDNQEPIKSTSYFLDDPDFPSHFEFENPETNCKYVSQPWIYNAFNSVSEDMEAVFKYAHPDLHVRIMGHHPFAGYYHNPKMAFVNSLWRLNNCLKDAKVDAKLWAIHGGCDQAWSVQEFYFNATTNKGQPWELTSLWVSRWDEDGLIREVRTWVDAGQIMRTLWDNEIWFNSSDRVHHYDFIPGPGGLPPIANKTELGGEL